MKVNQVQMGSLPLFYRPTWAVVTLKNNNQSLALVDRVVPIESKIFKPYVNPDELTKD